jgi:hypothetical protein
MRTSDGVTRFNGERRVDALHTEPTGSEAASSAVQ